MCDMCLSKIKQRSFQYYYGDEINDGEMSKTCSMNANVLAISAPLIT